MLKTPTQTYGYVPFVLQSRAYGGVPCLRLQQFTPE